jgi:hypothetical protein
VILEVALALLVGYSVYEIMAILDDAKKAEDLRLALVALAQARRTLEVIGGVTKELNRNPTIDLHLSPQWMQVKAVILSALDQNPEIFAEIEAAFEKAEALNVDV